MPLPRIGITTSVEDNQQRLDLRYVAAIEAAGGLPIVLPTVSREETAAAAAELVDALVIPGGPAILDGLVGALPHDIDPPDPRRVQSDRWILAAFTRRPRPVLGICYGMQFLNAEAGGRIFADVQAQLSGAQVHSSSRGGTMHAMDIAPDSRLAAILGRSVLDVNTYHIQAVAEVGQGYRVVGTAQDGVIEAIESEDGRVLGLQFHPERQLQDLLPVFEDLVRRAAQT